MDPMMRIAPSSRSRILKDTRGFTLVELLLVLAIISILAAVAQPNLHRALVKARATDVVGDLNVIKVAILTYQADQNEWPRDRNRGQIPRGLEEYLPEGFSFRGEDYTLDYDNWSGKRKTKFDIGLTYISRDQELGLEVLEMLGSNVWSDGKTKFTWVIEG
jgi:prepilin-type N-terminal cleavage/methylation domain-containing protein